MDARRAVILGQIFTVIAMLRLVSTRLGDATGDAPRLFGVDSLALVAAVALLASISLIAYALQMEN